MQQQPRDILTTRQFVAKNGYCRICRVNGIGKKRAAFGHLICKPCGERKSQADRRSWCVVQPYGKGGYQFVTATSAFEVVRQTNQKHIR
jgi:hypothetical protein